MSAQTIYDCLYAETTQKGLRIWAVYEHGSPRIRITCTFRGNFFMWDLGELNHKFHHNVRNYLPIYAKIGRAALAQVNLTLHNNKRFFELDRRHQIAQYKWDRVLHRENPGVKIDRYLCDSQNS